MKLLKTKQAKNTCLDKSLDKTLIIGVGGGGQNIVNYINTQINFYNTEFLAINSDEQFLNAAKVNTLLFRNIFQNSTNSLGCGGNVKLGEKLAKLNVKNLTKKLKNVSSVILVATLGGGFGTGALPVIANFLNTKNIPISIIVTLPFYFEGNAKRDIALKCIKDLKKVTTNFLLIENQIVLKENTKHKTMQEVFNLINRNILEYIIQNIKKTDTTYKSNEYQYYRQF